jgi:hypothetical protein
VTGGFAWKNLESCHLANYPFAVGGSAGMTNFLKWAGAAVTLNWVIWWAEAVAIGGTAVGGRISDGHYYVVSHGAFTEVSRSMFAFSIWHTYSTWISFSLAIIAGIIWKRMRPRTAN